MVARRAALFIVKLCRAILQGLRNQLEHDRRWSRDAIGVNTTYEDLNDEILKVQSGSEAYFDDITGQPLDASLAREARR